MAEFGLLTVFPMCMPVDMQNPRLFRFLRI